MACESKNYNTEDQRKIVDLAKLLMPLTFGDGEIVSGHVNTKHYPVPNAPMELHSINGNRFNINECLTQFFFEQSIYFCKYEFHRIDHRPVLRETPIQVGGYYTEKADCAAVIENKQVNGKRGYNEVDWHVDRVKELFGVVI